MILFVLFAFAVNAQSNENAAKEASRLAAPKAKKAVLDPASQDPLLVPEQEYDFGEIPAGEPVEHIFRIVNRGSKPMKIEQVRASCGCTTPVWSKDAFQPKDTSRLVVGYNAAEEGAFYRTVTVVFSDDIVKNFYIKGRVVTPKSKPLPLTEQPIFKPQ